MKLNQLVGEEIPRVSEIVSSAEAELQQAQADLSERHALLARTLEALSAESQDASRTKTRLLRIEEDLQRNRDARALLNLGAEAIKDVAQQRCPTCHQPIVDALTPLAEGQEVMSLDENIAFLEEQRRTFRALLSNQGAIVEARDRQAHALREQVSELRGEIRTLKETLVSDGRVPSIAAVRKRVRLQDELERLGKAEDSFQSALENLRELSGEWRELQISKHELPTRDISGTDEKKIKHWSALLREQLREYDFRSLEISEITVSEDTYRPQHAGFDLPTNISASDFIRIIWAYLSSLRETGLTYETNHPGLLIFDEPKQQSAKDLSFEQLLRRAARAGDQGHQVIFATSEKEERLLRMLHDVPHSYHSYAGYMIGPLPERNESPAS